jgi:hypothetical protein
MGAKSSFKGDQNICVAVDSLKNSEGLANPGEDPQFHPIEKLSAKNYQTRLLIEFAEFVGQSEGAKFVWIEGDGTFNFAIDPDDIPDGVQAVPVSAEEELSVVARA